MGEATCIDQFQTKFDSFRPLCPDCGTAVVEVDSSRENGVLYVWYKCSRRDCSGQWLEKVEG